MLLIEIFIGVLIAFVTLVFVVSISACMNEQHSVEVRQYDILKSCVVFAMIVCLVVLEVKFITG